MTQAFIMSGRLWIAAILVILAVAAVLVSYKRISPVGSSVNSQNAVGDKSLLVRLYELVDPDTEAQVFPVGSGTIHYRLWMRVGIVPPWWTLASEGTTSSNFHSSINQGGFLEAWSVGKYKDHVIRVDESPDDWRCEDASTQSDGSVYARCNALFTDVRLVFYFGRKITYSGTAHGHVTAYESSGIIPINSGELVLYGWRVKVKAIPDEGYEIAYWTVDGTRYEASRSILVTMDDDHDVVAHFARVGTLKVSSTEGGTTDPSEGTYTYILENPKTINLKATPNEGYRFVKWEVKRGDHTNTYTDPSISVTLTEDHPEADAKAYFNPIRGLRVLVSDQDGGSLSSGKPVKLSPADLNGVSQAGNGDTLTYDKGTQVTLTSDNLAGYRFDHWEGDCSGGGSCTLVMDSFHEAKSIQWKLQNLKVQVVDQDGHDLDCTVNLDFTAPSGSHHATEPDGDYSNKVISGIYKHTEVKASPNDCSGYRFDHWELDGSTWSGGSFTMDKDRTIKAVYWKQVTLKFKIRDDQKVLIGAKFHLTFTKPSGDLHPNVPDEGDYGNDDVLTMDIHTKVTSSPNAYQGYSFDHWNGPCLGSSEQCHVTMNEDLTISATYWKLVDLSVEVKDELGASTRCKIRLKFSPPASAENNPPRPDGDYGDGDVITGLYRGTEVRHSALTCKGYRFDHWELDGKEWSGNSFHMDDDRTLKGVYWKQYTLKIKEEPDSSGDTAPLRVGTHILDRGTVVRLFARPNAGFELDSWIVDGYERDEWSIVITMDGPHEVIVRFSKVERPAPVIPQGQSGKQEFETCSLNKKEVESLNYRGAYADLNFNQDLLESLGGRASPEQKSNYVVLGGPDVIPFEWSKYGVNFGKGTLEVGGGTYTSDYSVRDYGVILMDCKDTVIRVAGINRFGTRAALMWLLNHPSEMSGKVLVVVQWEDLNWDHIVQEGEIRVIYRNP